MFFAWFETGSATDEVNDLFDRGIREVNCLNSRLSFVLATSHPTVPVELVVHHGIPAVNHLNRLNESFQAVIAIVFFKLSAICEIKQLLAPKVAVTSIVVLLVKLIVEIDVLGSIHKVANVANGRISQSFLP